MHTFFKICASHIPNRIISCAPAKAGKLTLARELCNYDFTDAAAEVELRIPFLAETTPDADEIFVICLVGDSSEINWAVARELALGLKYAPLWMSHLLEEVTKMSLHDFVIDEGEDSLAEAEVVILENINTNAREVVATLGGTPYGFKMYATAPVSSFKLMVSTPNPLLEGQ